MRRKKKLRKTGHGARARPDEAKLRAQHEARDVSAIPRETAGPDRTQHDEAPVSVEAETVPYDEALLDAARTQWQFGDWMSLAALDAARIEHHPERARLALLAAVGRFQCADLNEAHRYIRLAQDWGISSGLVDQVLISGTHNLLGCVRAALGSHEKARQHFADAVRLSGVSGDARLLTRIREEWQTKERNTTSR
mgnify:CR=1 FL=1